MKTRTLTIRTPCGSHGLLGNPWHFFNRHDIRLPVHAWYQQRISNQV